MLQDCKIYLKNDINPKESKEGNIQIKPSTVRWRRGRKIIYNTHIPMRRPVKSSKNYYYQRTYRIYIRPKKHFKNEQRSKDAAAKKDLIQVE